MLDSSPFPPAAVPRGPLACTSMATIPVRPLVAGTKRMVRLLKVSSALRPAWCGRVDADEGGTRVAAIWLVLGGWPS